MRPGEKFYTKETGWTAARIAEQERRADLTKLTAEDVCWWMEEVICDFSLEQKAEIRRRLERLERLEQCEALVKRYLLYHDGVARCESAEERQACLCSICDAARAALEGK